MIRNLRALGLSIAVVFAASLTVASAASAVEFHSEIENTTLEAEQLEPQEFEFEAGTASCEESTLKGTQSKKTAADLTLTAFYSGCSGFGAFNVTVNTNGCNLKFYAGEKVGEKYEGKTDLVCPEGKQYDVHVTTPSGTLWCTVLMAPWTGKVGTFYTYHGSGKKRHTTLHWILSEIFYYQVEGSAPGACKTGAHNNGVWRATYTLEGFEKGGEQVGIWIE